MMPARFDLETSGRFRPMFFVGSFVETAVFGTDARGLHAWRLLLTFATALLLYRAGVALFAGDVAGYSLMPLVLLAPDPGPANVWYMLATWCEAYGTLFVLLSLLASSAAASTRDWRWDALALLLAAAAGASKESFVLLIPGLLLVRIWLGQKENQNSLMDMLTRCRILVVAYGALFLVYAAVIVAILVGRPDTYGGRSAAAHTDIVAEVIHDLLATPYMSAGMIPVMVMASCLLLRRQGLGWLRRNWFGFAIVAACMAGQFAIYGTRGGFWDHYWLPYLLPVAALNAGAMAWLWDVGPRAFSLTAAAGLLIWSLNGARVNAATTWNFAEKGAVRMEVVETVARAIPPTGRVLVVANQRLHSEWSFSVMVFLGFHGRGSSDVWLYDVAAGDRSRFAEGFGFPNGGPLSDVSCSEFDAIVFLDLPEESDTDWARWYGDGHFDRERIGRDLVSLSLRQRQVVREPFVCEYAINQQLRSER